MSRKGRKKHEPKPLDDIDQRLIRLAIASPNLSLEELSARVGIGPTVISARRHNPVFLEALEKYQEQFAKSAVELIRDHQKGAVQVVAKIMHDQAAKDSDRLNAAKIFINGLPEKASGMQSSSKSVRIVVKRYSSEDPA